MTTLDWLAPWEPIHDWPLNQRKQSEAQLSVEAGSNHPLYQIPVTLVGVRRDCDDVLFHLNDGTERFAVVHLTWRQSQEPMPWPETQMFASIDEFATDRMRMDHDEWTQE